MALQEGGPCRKEADMSTCTGPHCGNPGPQRGPSCDSDLRQEQRRGFLPTPGVGRGPLENLLNVGLPLLAFPNSPFQNTVAQRSLPLASAQTEAKCSLCLHNTPPAELGWRCRESFSLRCLAALAPRARMQRVAVCPAFSTGPGTWQTVQGH